jgi:hypothetical protein
MNQEICPTLYLLVQSCLFHKLEGNYLEAIIVDDNFVSINSKSKKFMINKFSLSSHGISNTGFNLYVVESFLDKDRKEIILRLLNDYDENDKNLKSIYSFISALTYLIEKLDRSMKTFK